MDVRATTAKPDGKDTAVAAEPTIERIVAKPLPPAPYTEPSSTGIDCHTRIALTDLESPAVNSELNSRNQRASTAPPRPTGAEVDTDVEYERNRVAVVRLLDVARLNTSEKLQEYLKAVQKEEECLQIYISTVNLKLQRK